MAGKEAIACILDINPSMDTEDDGSLTTRLELGKDAISKVISSKVLAGKSHEFALFFCGSDTSNNFLHDSMGGDYKYVEEVYDTARGSCELLARLSSLNSN